MGTSVFSSFKHTLRFGDSETSFLRTRRCVSRSGWVTLPPTPPPQRCTKVPPSPSFSPTLLIFHFLHCSHLVGVILYDSKCPPKGPLREPSVLCRAHTSILSPLLAQGLVAKEACLAFVPLRPHSASFLYPSSGVPLLFFFQVLSFCLTQGLTDSHQENFTAFHSWWGCLILIGQLHFWSCRPLSVGTVLGDRE